jgi:hypothetical protein
MNPDDEQTLREMRHFIRELLKCADVLPAALATMLRDYEPELYCSPPGRWNGIGDAGQSESLAVRIGQLMTDGQWPEGTHLDASLSGHWRARGETRANVERTLRLLAARGELTVRHGMYYTRPRDENH